jgi:cysteine desulfurase
VRQNADPINLDNNATTRPSEASVLAMRRAAEELWQNPSSVHRAGQAARQQVELARESMAELLGVKPRELTLTSGGTEALDLAIRGLLAGRARSGTPPLIATTKVEHAAVRDLVEDLVRTGAARVAWLELEQPTGLVDIARACEAITRETALVVVQWANNETGAIQPVKAIGQHCAALGVPFLVDAVQWVGKMPTRLVDDPLPCDLLVASPHKFHGVKGVGVLWARPALRVTSQVLGSQELGRRGGTENVPGILAAGAAAQEARQFVQDARQIAALAALRDRFEAGVRAALPDVVVNGPTSPGTRLWNTTNLGFPALEAEALLMLLSERGLLASAGAACSSGSLEPSPVLLAMGIDEKVAHGSLRFSLSKETTPDEIERALEIVVQSVTTLRGRSWD